MFYKEYLNQFNDHVVLTSNLIKEIKLRWRRLSTNGNRAWLAVIYHGVKGFLNGYIYSACAALPLDLENLKRNSAAPYPV
jgi:hypothetical protein